MHSMQGLNKLLFKKLYHIIIDTKKIENKNRISDFIDKM